MAINILFYFAYSKIKLISIFLALFISFHDSRNIYVQLSEINLIIKGSGYLPVLYEYFYLDPTEVIVNGELKSLCKKSCEFDKDLNNLTIKFNNEIESCDNMFYGLTNIIEIDLLKFDTSKVQSMESTFSHFINLEKINFGKINTSSVKSMKSLFLNCSQLTSIDLSNFDTSSVTLMNQMFARCDSLKSLDVSKFNTQKVENVEDMFAYCYSLMSINVSNFDTSKVTNMKGMFTNAIH